VEKEKSSPALQEVDRSGENDIAAARRRLQCRAATRLSAVVESDRSFIAGSWVNPPDDELRANPADRAK
jgi:hypothetical protein